jgi:hypothetical protein
MTNKEMVEGIISKDIPLHSASLQEQGMAGPINLDETEMVALLYQWKAGEAKLERYVVVSNDILDEMSVPQLADAFYDSALKCLEKQLAA